MADTQRRSETSTSRDVARPGRFRVILGGVLAVSVITVAVLGVTYGDKLLCGLGSEQSTGGQFAALEVEQVRSTGVTFEITLFG
jgi:hypothetical protein